MSRILFRVTLSTASMYIEPGSDSFSGKTSGSLRYDSGMKLLHVLLTRNLLKASRWHVTSISTMTTGLGAFTDLEGLIFEYRVGALHRHGFSVGAVSHALTFYNECAGSCRWTEGTG